MKYLIFVILMVLTQSPFSMVRAEESCIKKFMPIGLPRVWGNQTPSKVICRKGYAISYNTQTKNPDWVIEKLTSLNLVGEATREKSRFKEDKTLKNLPRAKLKDYAKNGYDRGHQAPAADMKWNQDAMDESFYLSNTAPQVGVGFNRGVWRHLEAEVRNWAKSHIEIFVITGPVYFDFAPTIGEGEIVVPDSFFKVIYDPKTQEAIAFLLPNMKLENKSYPAFITSIREIEEKTGFNFLSALPFRLQNQIEKAPSKMWGQETLQSSR